MTVDPALLFAELPHSENWEVLGQKSKIAKKTVPNRIAYQPMEGCDANPDGTPGELTVRRYQRFAAGGAGLIWLEATAVMPQGMANPRQLQINAHTLDPLKRLCDDIKETGAKANGQEPFVCIQLTHSGRYSKPEGAAAPLIACNSPILEGDTPLDSSRILSDADLDRVRDAMIQGALLAQQAGFDAADIKCSHRYLFSELLSAYHRPGKYGGSFENRTRLLLDSISGARQICDRDFVIASRMNLYDGYAYPYGFGVSPESGTDPDFTESIRLAQALIDHGTQLLNLTMGNPYNNPHVNRPYKRGGYIPPEAPIQGVRRMLNGSYQVTKALTGDFATVCSGLSYLGKDAPGVAAACVEQGWFTFAGFGRESFAYPDIAADLCQGRLNEKKLCITCSKCTELMRAGGTTGCILRDQEVYLPLYRKLVQKR